MKNRFAKLAAVAAVGTLAMTACSGNSTNNSSSTGSNAPAGSSSSAAAAAKLACPSGSLSGAGSSAQDNAMQEAIKMYNDECGNKAKINYSPTGSGDGIKKFIAKQVDFAGSDSALKKDSEVGDAKTACGGNDAWHLPMIAGPIAVAYNVKGVSDLTLKSSTIAKIFKGQITTWDDAAIKADNPGKNLPSDKINVFFRSDSSGTTDNFTDYLNKAAGDVWTDAHSKDWKGAGQGKDKSAGVASAVKSTENSISYVEWSFANDNKLSMAAVDNGKGAVKLTGDAVAKLVSGAKADGTGNDLRLSIQFKDTDAGVYPIALVTYEIACSKGMDAAKLAVFKDFMTFYASDSTQQDLQKLGYAPLSADTAKKINDAIKAMA